jgi:hypothetical protein
LTTARDEAGNVVGKGNLQQQIEQVGKNVGACLEAGGASVKDIVFTVSYVNPPRPSGESLSPKRKLAAILHADVAGFSRLMGEDEAGTHQALGELRRAVDPLSRRTADGSSARQATACWRIFQASSTH